MGRISEFNKSLKQWFTDHGYDNINFVEGEDFCYYFRQQVVQYALIDSPKTDNHFSQFLYEYGAEYSCHPFVASLLHEVGHHYTLTSFNEEQMEKDTYAKDNHTHTGTIEENYWYWELPTEFAANMWAIEWINTHFEELCELHDLCSDGLENIFSDPNIVQQVMDWRDDIINGAEYTPLCISEEE